MPPEDNPMQSMFDLADALIVVGFVAAVLTLIAYVWRAEHHRAPRH